MCMLKDPEGQLLLTRDVAESILDLYKEPLVAFYRELENKSIIKQKGDL